jgi:phosphoglycerate dehydrogenase-like enzyme
MSTSTGEARVRVVIPDDFPAVLGSSAAWSALKARAETGYYDDLPGSEERLVERIGDAEVVLNIRSSSRFSAQVLDACPKLRLLSLWGTGTDHVDLPAAARAGVTVTNTPGVAAVSIAEHTMALLFAVARGVVQLDGATRDGRWERGRMTDLRGKVCGVLGYGAIGRAFARIAAGIGMKVIVWTVHPERHPEVACCGLDELYGTADVVSIHLRLSNSTERFIGAGQFARMKPGAILINTARGAIVDEAALIEALDSGRLAGAGLDVFAKEPLPRENPFAGHANVVLTPHCAGITPEAVEAGLAMAVENIWAFLEGRAEHVV